MSSDTVKWLIAREANCLRLAQYKVGNDKEGWMQDAAYFNDAHTALTTKTAELEALRVELEACRRDAERYRWLRKTGGRYGGIDLMEEWNDDIEAPDAELDEAIDKAAAKGGEPG